MKYRLENGSICVECRKNKRGNGFNIVQIEKQQKKEKFLYFEEEKYDENREGSYDNQYFGGMEFLFPNDEKEVFQGKNYSDHGVLWTIPFAVKTEGNRIFATAFLKEEIKAKYYVLLKENSIHLELSICNLSKKRMPFLVRLHPSFLLEEGDEIRLYSKESFLEGEDNKYCSSKISSFDSKKSIITTRDHKRINLEKVASFLEEELFFHMEQEEGKFKIEKKFGTLICTYDTKQLPFLTTYTYYKKEVGRIAIIEPANGCGASFGNMERNGSLHYLEPLQKVSFPIMIEIQ